jgi:biotin carboxyl carrier protein
LRLRVGVVVLEEVVAVERDGRYRVSGRGGAAGVVEVADPLGHLARAGRGRRGAGGSGRVDARMPGRVVAVLAPEGSVVVPGQGVVVVEAMKMENEIAADRAGTVRRVHVAPGQAVEAGEPLFEVGVKESGEPPGGGAPLPPSREGEGSGE